MNAARPIFSAVFPPSATPLPAAPATPTTPKRRSRKAKAQPAPTQVESDEYAACLVQARICREQAQEAARLKRFKAAVGLFQTAISLCQRAVSLRKSAPPSDLAPVEADSGADGDGEAREYLQVLAVELSAYDELARSMNRPLINGGR